jgi:hypothetical protein
LGCIPELRDELTHKWQQAGKYHASKDELIAHIMAERQASIEGRMYLEVKQRGVKPSPNIPQLADQELKAHRAQTKALTEQLMIKYRLAEGAARTCAKNIQRFQETHGEKPSSEQMAAVVQISRELDKRIYPPSLEQANIEYLPRHNGDSRFRELSSQGRELSEFENFPYDQPYIKAGSLVNPGNEEPYRKESAPITDVSKVEKEKFYGTELSI